MRYAVIADIHGNLPALQAVLRDAGDVDGYIFLGDYCSDFPWYDEVVDTIRALPNAYVVRGNKEDYIQTLMGQDPATWTDGQMAAIYHMMGQLSPSAKAYLTRLPRELTITTEEGGYFHAFHAASHLFGELLSPFNSFTFRQLKEQHGAAYDVAGVLSEGLAENANLKPTLDTLPDGLYLFGHNHLQWSGFYHGKLLLNPGGCGLTMDYAEGAPYAVAEYANGRWRCQLRRAAYDMASVAETLKASALYKAAPHWCEVILCEFLGCREYVHSFLKHVERTAVSIGDKARPYGWDTWNAAFACWDREVL
jgi:predicted phosphodiesterase